MFSILYLVKDCIMVAWCLISDPGDPEPGWVQSGANTELVPRLPGPYMQHSTATVCSGLLPCTAAFLLGFFCRLGWNMVVAGSLDVAHPYYLLHVMICLYSQNYCLLFYFFCTYYIFHCLISAFILLLPYLQLYTEAGTEIFPWSSFVFFLLPHTINTSHPGSVTEHPDQKR